MYGVTGTIQAAPGHGDQLAGLLQQAADTVATLPACRLYVVGRVEGRPDVIHVYEVWDDVEALTASLGMDEVQSIIAEARPIIAGLGERTELSIESGLDPGT